MVKKIILLALIIIPNLTFADTNCYVASGYGTTAVNGTYVDTGLTQHSKAVYLKDGGGIYLEYAASANDAWTYVLNHGSQSVQYYYAISSNATPEGLSWTTDVPLGGTAPAGTTIIGDCPSSGGESSSTATSSSITYNDWIFATTVQIFLLSFIGLGILFSFFKRQRR